MALSPGQQGTLLSIWRFAHASHAVSTPPTGRCIILLANVAGKSRCKMKGLSERVCAPALEKFTRTFGLKFGPCVRPAKVAAENASSKRCMMSCGAKTRRAARAVTEAAGRAYTTRTASQASQNASPAAHADCPAQLHAPFLDPSVALFARPNLRLIHPRQFDPAARLANIGGLSADELERRSACLILCRCLPINDVRP